MPTIGKYGKVLFSEQDLSFIHDNWEKMTNAQLAKALGLKVTRLRNELLSMGLKRMELEYWTPEQVEFLKANYKQMGDVELAEFFAATWPKAKGWSKKHIEKKRRYLKLKRSSQDIEKIKERNTKHGRFKICVIKRWETTGQAPIGETRIWKQQGVPIMVIKTENGWVHYNRWLWEQNYGSLESDQLVVPKDGTQLICEIGDLEVINRKEHALRNRTRYNRYPEEIKEAIKLKNKLLKVLENE